MRLALRHGPEVGLGKEGGGVTLSEGGARTGTVACYAAGIFFFWPDLSSSTLRCHSVTLIAELARRAPLPGRCVTLWEVGGVMQLAFWQDMSSSTLNAIRSRRSRARLARTAPRPSGASATHLLSICTYPLTTIYA
jgi:hypothetical protein